MAGETREEFLKRLGRRIRELRVQHGLTQEAFEDGTEISITSRGLQEIEYGNKDVRITTLRKIAKRLEIQLPELLDME